MPGRTCPHCGYRSPLATDLVGGARPSDGDVSLCINCGAAAIFADRTARLRLPTSAELEAIAADPLIQRARALILERRGR